MSEDLSSGDGVPPPSPDQLPHPALWSPPPPGRQPAAYSDLAEEHVPSNDRPTRARWAMAWTAVALGVLTAVLLAVALLLRSWVPLVPAAVAVAAGLVLARRGRILTDVSVGQSPLPR